MTKIDIGRPPLRRETATLERGRPIVVLLHGRYVELRIKGLHEKYCIAWDVLLDHIRIKNANARLSKAGQLPLPLGEQR